MRRTYRLGADGDTWYYLDPKTGVMKSNVAFVVGGKTYVAKASVPAPPTPGCRGEVLVPDRPLLRRAYGLGAG
jgi:hypothetical protein